MKRKTLQLAMRSGLSDKDRMQDCAGRHGVQMQLRISGLMTIIGFMVVQAQESKAGLITGDLSTVGNSINYNFSSSGNSATFSISAGQILEDEIINQRLLVSDDGNWTINLNIFLDPDFDDGLGISGIFQHTPVGGVAGPVYAIPGFFVEGDSAGWHYVNRPDVAMPHSLGGYPGADLFYGQQIGYFVDTVTIFPVIIDRDDIKTWNFKIQGTHLSAPDSGSTFALFGCSLAGLLALRSNRFKVSA